MMSRLTELTYAVKKACPICRRGFDVEKLLSKKFGPQSWDLSLKNIYDSSIASYPDPIIYSLIVCPACLYTAFESDFDEPMILSKRDLEATREAARVIIQNLALTSGSFEGLRDVRVGLASYYLAELWYDARAQLPTRHFRTGLSLYRRVWLLDIAERQGVITREHCAGDRIYSLALAEASYEQSFMSERLADSLFCGPDYAVNFGQEAFPYIIAVSNYLLVKEPSLSPAERLTRIAKAWKFIGIAMTARPHKGAAELRNKVIDLRALLKAEEEGRGVVQPAGMPQAAGSNEAAAVQSAAVVVTPRPAPAPESTASSPRPFASPRSPIGSVDDSSSPVSTKTSPVRFQPTVEVVDWDIHFEALYERYGSSHERGDVIFREGETGEEVCFILDGKVHVQKNYNAGGRDESRLLAVLGRGAFFGEMALLDSSPRFASVMAAEPTRLVRVNRQNFEVIVRNHPAIAITIMAALVRRLRGYDEFVRTQILPLIVSDVSGAGSAAPLSGALPCPVSPPVGGAKRKGLGIGDTLMVELQGLMLEAKDTRYE